MFILLINAWVLVQVSFIPPKHILTSVNTLTAAKCPVGSCYWCGG